MAESKLINFLNNTTSFSREYDERIENLSLEYIPVEELYITQSQQNTFSVSHVLDIANEYHPAIVRTSSIARINGKNILWEGHHSAIVNWIKGFNSVPCIVYECDNMDFKQVPSIEKFDASQLAMLLEMFIAETGVTSLDEIKQHIKEQDINIIE